MSDKIYIKAQAKESKYGIRLSGKAEDVIKQIQEHTNEKGYFNWNINKRKEVGKYGETHSVTVDTWRPDAQPEQTNNREGVDDIPF